MNPSSARRNDAVGIEGELPWAGLVSAPCTGGLHSDPYATRHAGVNSGPDYVEKASSLATGMEKTVIVTVAGVEVGLDPPRCR